MAFDDSLGAVAFEVSLVDVAFEDVSLPVDDEALFAVPLVSFEALAPVKLVRKMSESFRRPLYTM